MKLTHEGKVFYPAEPCDGLEEKILLMQAGGLSDSEEKQLMAHIETCGACKTLYRHYELIDENIRDHLASQQNKPPKAMPKKLRLMLSEASKQHFVSQLRELGHSMLFQQSEAADRIRPWTEPLSLNYCVKNLHNSCSSLLRDPFIQEVDLTKDFVKDCNQFLYSLIDTPKRFFEAKYAKEAFERALIVEPNHSMSLKSMANFHYLNNDLSSSVTAYKRLLKLKLTSHQRFCSLVNLCSNSINNEDYTCAEQYLDDAGSIKKSFQLYYVKFRFFFLTNKLNKAEENLIELDSTIESGNQDLESLSILFKWLDKRHDYFIERLSCNQKAQSILNKYRGHVIKYTQE